ncbi:MalY/PatB family protein [Williamsoniiplasma lucivorax]|uniref:cysteine-S-conjugate beta-lyase n=1 Tax=Williamsoniiplasma lucivorax TaxID=209274 RepID=A0A2S5R9V1_9MOLU|nr:aminotransferase class I/II-fold pyridoxal phosphate-dependent enzyme [Williamsoniiplasma lucivorax]PPE04109.1 cystathione beta-lyase [Williamsoniiplasma lucivorax]
MKNIFDKKINRQENKEMKWSPDYLAKEFKLDTSQEIFNLGIGDLDFETPKPIVDALKKRASQKTYSYSYIQDEAIEAIVFWYQKVHHLALNPKLVQIVDGVLDSMIQIIKTYTKHGESVLIQTPVYKPFQEMVEDTKRKIITNKLIYQDGEYHVDFKDFEQQIIANNVKLFIWCNPHNPGGKIWKDAEINKMLKICKKHHVFILADEIHGDLAFNIPHNSILRFSKQFQDFAIVSSADKSFNIAGLNGSYIIFANQEVLAKIMTRYKQNRSVLATTFFQPALITGFTNPEVYAWYLELKTYLYDNFILVKKELGELDCLEIMNLDASHLVWIKINTHYDWTELEKTFLKNGVIVVFSKEFADAEPGWFRLNFGLPRPELIKAMKKIKAIFEL